MNRTVVQLFHPRRWAVHHQSQTLAESPLSLTLELLRDTGSGRFVLSHAMLSADLTLGTLNPGTIAESSEPLYPISLILRSSASGFKYRSRTQGV